MANNTQISTPTKSQDEDIRIVWDKVSGDDYISVSDAQSREVSVSGRLEGKYAHTQIGKSVTLYINRRPYDATIDKNLGFKFKVLGRDFIEQKPYQFSASLNDRGNTVYSPIKKYTVEQYDPNLVKDGDIRIVWGKVSDDDHISVSEAQSREVSISGRLEGEYAHTQIGKSVTLYINRRPYDATVDENLNFKFKVLGRDFIEQTPYQFSASLNDRGKIVHSPVKQYTVEQYDPNLVKDGDVRIVWDKVSGDDLINVSEAQSYEVSVSGRVEGKYAHTQIGKSVTLYINRRPYDATVDENLNFKFKVLGRDFIEQKPYQFSASLNDRGKIVTSPIKEYSVSPDVIAKIHLDDVNLGLAEEIGRVRLSGKLDFSNSLFQQGKNEALVRAIVLKIGGKEYNVGVRSDNHMFYLDLTQTEYQALKGKNITYELKYYNDSLRWQWENHFSYVTDKNGQQNKKIVHSVSMSSDFVKKEADKIKVIFDDANVQTTQQLTLNSVTKTTVSGRVEGAQVGDKVHIQVGNKNYYTTVKNNLIFSVKVENNHLKSINKIQAHVQTQNAEGENIRVSDEGNVLHKIPVSSAFQNPHQSIDINNRKVQHSDSDYNFPYFIHAIDRDWNSDTTFLNERKMPFGMHNQSTPVVKFYFATKQDYANGLHSDYEDVISGSYSDFSQELKEHIRHVYQEFEKTANLKFEEVNSKDDADTILMTARFTHYSSGYAYFGKHVIFNNYYDELTEFKKYINFHEIFHTLGATHTDADSTDKFRIYPYAQHETTTEVSTMSYTDNFSNNSGRNNLGLYDLAYLHYRFGVSKTRNTGNDVYRFNQYNPMVSDGNIYIWDARGVDTFDASKENEGVTVNLTPGSWIYRGIKSDTFLIKERIQTNYNPTTFKNYFTEFGDNVEFTGNPFTYAQNTYVEGQAFIGYGTQIENLVGSAHADVLKGNKAGNNIYGGNGNDQIWGDTGSDYLDGGRGADILYGGTGNDIFVVDNVGDKVNELRNQGTDTVYSYINYRLSDFVENLSLFGNAKTGIGNALNNTIQGNDLNNILNGQLGNDRLDGGRGNDTLIGSHGKDTFVFSSLLDGTVDTIRDFTLSQDKIELALNVFSGLTASNLAERIKYDQATGALSYDADGAGNADAIHFATLQNKVDLKIDETHFILA